MQDSIDIDNDDSINTNTNTNTNNNKCEYPQFVCSSSYAFYLVWCKLPFELCTILFEHAQFAVQVLNVLHMLNWHATVTYIIINIY